MVHFYRNVFSHVPTSKVRDVTHMLKAIHAQESREAADHKAKAIIADLRAGKMSTAADLVEQTVHATLSGPGLLVHFQTASPASTLRLRDCVTSQAPHGPPSAT
jgi:hypothetical protein